MMLFRALSECNDVKTCIESVVLNKLDTKKLKKAKNKNFTTVNFHMDNLIVKMSSVRLNLFKNDGRNSSLKKFKSKF